MVKIVMFGGTSEGRKLCQLCSSLALPIVYCAATEDGKRAVASLPHINTHIGRLASNEMAELFRRNKPMVVIDATHPYAKEASININNACSIVGVPLLRIDRKSLDEDGCNSFADSEALLAWLEKKKGNIFATTGSSGAKILAQLSDFKKRVWLRILPSIDSLRICLDLDFPPEHIICMQGPFSEEMNYTMFKESNAKILVTKNSGSAGGFAEKISAAKSLRMLTAVITKPENHSGVTLEEACERIKELSG